jgi:surface antigen
VTKFIPIVIAIAALSCANAAVAEPIQITDDENYSRLASWEQHLDQTISDRATRGSFRARDAWRFQKRLDGIEIHLLQAYYQSDNGLDDGTARSYADQLRSLSRDLRDNWNGYYAGGYGGGPAYGPPAPPPSNYGYYQQGRYESDCHRGNRAAGTIFGAIAGGLVGGAVSHGNGGAVVGGVIVGGVAGNALSRDIDCDDQRYAYSRYDDGFNGPVGQDYRWDHGDRYGTFTPTREYHDGNYVCRDFQTTSYRGGQEYQDNGTACRQDDGYWHIR